MPHVVVIGAGPAGAICTLLLARAGIPATLIEQHRFPREKVCGECISAMGIEVLSRLGLDDLLRSAGVVSLTQALIHAPNGSTAEIPLSHPMWGISRRAMDELLRDQAVAAGAELLQPARCEAIEHGPQIVIRVRSLETNQISELRPTILVLADGKRAARQTGDFGLKAHFRGIRAPRDAISLFGVDGSYGGIAPIEDRLWNLAFSVPGRRIHDSSGDLDRLFDKIRSENPQLQHQMADAARVGRWLVSPLPRFGVASSWMRATIPIGNAAASIEPIGGEGIGLAIASAELAAKSLIDAFKRNAMPDTHGLRSAYRKLWRMRSMACRLAGLTLSSPSCCNAIIPLLDRSGLATAALHALGKP